MHKLEFEADEATYYRHVNEEVVTSLKERVRDTPLSAYANALTKINRLRQICNLGVLYQNRTVPELGFDDSSAKVQELFDGMLSSGVLVCYKCSRDPLRGNLNNEPLLGGLGDDRQPQTRLAECAELIRASCFALAQLKMRLEDLKCRHLPSCRFFEVRVSSAAQINADTPTLRYPPKIRALRKDLLLLPEGEKWFDHCPPI